MDIDIIVGFVSFVALVLVWAFAPQQPATAAAPVATQREAMA
jgi:hypothetical protein